MTAQSPASPELLVFPEWVAIVLYFVVVPLGLLVGYLAFRGFRRTDRRNAQLLAVGLVLLTVVDTLLGTSVEVATLVDLPRAGPLFRAVVQLLGVTAIVYAMYGPDRSSSSPPAGGPRVDTPAETPTPESEDDRSDGTNGDQDGESR
jgi:hypothetical protein